MTPIEMTDWMPDGPWPACSLTERPSGGRDRYGNDDSKTGSAYVAGQ